MVKSTHIILVLFIFSNFLIAQEKSYIKNGLLSGRLTLSPTTSLANSSNYFFLHGDLERYLNSKISIIGEGYYFINQLGNTVIENFEYNHSVFFGTNWHFTKQNNDLYIGLQPGVSFTKLNPKKAQVLISNNGVNPLLSASLGYNYYLHQNFHFFIQTKIVIGEHYYDRAENLSEFRFSAGLGFNLNANKKELSH